MNFVGFKYKSHLYESRILTLGLSLFANTGLVLLLSSANFEGFLIDSLTI